MNRPLLLLYSLLAVACSYVDEDVVRQPPPVTAQPQPQPRSQHELQMAYVDGQLRQAQESRDPAAAAHWERLRAWELNKQAARIEGQERAAWAAASAVTVEMTPAEITGKWVRIDATVAHVDEQMAYLDFETKIHFCRRHTPSPTHVRWGRGHGGGHRGGGYRWRGGGGHRRSGWAAWRARGGGYVNSPRTIFPGWTTEPFSQGREEVKALLKPARESSPLNPAESTPPPACRDTSKTWTIRVEQPINYHFQPGDRLQLLGRPHRTDDDSVLALSELRFKFVGRGETVLYAALPDRGPL